MKPRFLKNQSFELLRSELTGLFTNIEEFKVLLPKLKLNPIDIQSQSINSVRDNNPKYLMAHKEVKRAEKLKWVDLGPDLPSVDLSGRYGYQSPDQFEMDASEGETYTVQLKLSIPIFSGFSSVYTKRSANSQILFAQKIKNQINKELAANFISSKENLLLV